MPEPWRTDGDGAEGEYSVISVSLELMTKEYASRRLKESDLNHFKPERNALKILKVVSQGPCWTEITTQDLPCKFGEVRILMVLDSSNGPMGPLKPHQIWAQGVSNGPHGPRTVGPQNQPKTQNGPKMPLKPNNQGIKKGPKGPQIQNLRNFQGQWGQDPPLKTFKKKNSNQGKNGQTSSWPIHNEVYDHIIIGHQTLSRRALWHSFLDITQGPCLERKEMNESQKKHISKLKALTQANRRGNIIQLKYDSEETKRGFSG
ncbi:hypothetical protein O181_049048 [Austropuccinia psidii MF-1]|uniref:Uncharacterized protein n=1 Tax=Austropuccinia psidii MF-1 TaxID=1389203 RepID=A0A9Q3HL16_9BASI|nr:hypothetical protein [Austropuccinia psidii MF-1]